jgi:YidC/Oxa1 family membrane protein insertase
LAFLNNSLIWVINSLYSLTKQVGLPSYGIAIILMTIIIKLILYPLTVKQMKSMKKMQLLQPKLKEIQEKHKGDPQKAQTETLELYKKAGTNPFTGCLPLLIQMPIFIALFNTLKHFTFTEGSQFLWLTSLHDKDPYYILPVIAGLSQFVQQKLSTTNMQDPTQRMMLMIMPVFFVWIASNVPAGLALYWVVFNLMGAIQQFFINKQPVELKEEVIVDDEKNRKKRKNR